MQMSNKWTQPIHNWDVILNQFSAIFEKNGSTVKTVKPTLNTFTQNSGQCQPKQNFILTQFRYSIVSIQYQLLQKLVFLPF